MLTWGWRVRGRVDDRVEDHVSMSGGEHSTCRVLSALGGPPRPRADTHIRPNIYCQEQGTLRRNLPWTRDN